MTEDEKKVVQNCIEEMCNSFVRVDAERDLQKNIVKRIKEETEVAPRVFRRMAKVAHNANFSEEKYLNEEFEELYEKIIVE